MVIAAPARQAATAYTVARRNISQGSNTRTHCRPTAQTHITSL